ncbi:phage tail tape measure protein [Pectobacterium brasiliense]|uniref:phage tail tape measure protein n=1 Tax=Pectobacterium brasiliense TaxID=180957 RepID=UPI0030CB4597
MSLNGVMPGRSFSTTLDDTKKSLQSLSDGLKQAQERQRQFNQSLERFGTVSSQAISRIAQATSRLNKSLHELETNQERLRRNKPSKETPSKETSGKSQSELASDFKTKREQFGFVMKPVVASVTHYASFEAQLRGISIAHDISSEQEKLMGQQLRQSSQRVNQTPDALLGSAGKLLERGMSKEQIKGVTDLTEVLGKTSTASGAALTDLTALSVTLDNVFNLKGAEVQKESLSRMLAGTKQGFSAALMAQYVPALASGFTAMGATGNQALSQLVSSLSATKGGDTEANTVARLESFMNAVGRTDIADSYGKAGVNYNALLKNHMKDGYSQYDAAVLIGNQLIDSKGSQFQKRWDMAAGNVDAQQSLMQRYGLQEVFRTPEAVNHAMSMKRNWQSYQATQQVMNSPAATQTLELDFARQNGTLTARWNRMTTSLLNIALNVGEALTPVLVSLSDALIPILDQLVTWTAANPELVRGIVMAVAGFFAFRMALSGAKLGMDILLPSLQSVWKGIQQGWQWLKGLNPKGLWQGILQGWQRLKAGLNLNSLWQGILQGWQRLKTGLNLNSLWPSIRAALSGLGSSAGALLGRILSSVMSSGFMMVVRVVLLLGGILLTLPAELIVGIGVAIAGLFALIYKYSDQISAFFASFIPDAVKNLFSSDPSEKIIANNNQAAAVLAPTPVSALSLQPTLPVELPMTEDTMPTPQQRVAMAPLVGGTKGNTVITNAPERVQVAFSPTIYLNGQKAAPTPEMTKTLTLSMNELENMLNKLLAQRERRGYA